MGGYAPEPGALVGVPFWPRFGARLLDLLVHYVISFGAGVIIGIFLAISASLNHTPLQPLIARTTSLSALTFIAAILGAMLYHVISEGGHGSSLGKLALGLVVLQEDGTPCRMGAALVRSLAYYVDALFFGIIAYVAMQKSPLQQRYGDQWAHTVVVRRSQVAPERLRSSGRFLGVLFLAAAADAALLLLTYAIKLVS